MKKSAVAIKYEKGDVAPKIVAKGRDKLAEIIIKIAREYNIHIEEQSLLSAALMQFDLGDYIPEEMYVRSMVIRPLYSEDIFSAILFSFSISKFISWLDIELISSSNGTDTMRPCFVTDSHSIMRATGSEFTCSRR